MKIAVGLFGIHYVKRLNHWARWITDVDYRVVYQNNKERIYGCFPNAEFDYYSSTYNSEVIDQLRNDFKFQNLKLQDVNTALPNGEEMFIRRNRIFKQTLELIIQSNKPYDYVLITRYDIEMTLKISALNFDYNKVNLFYRSKWEDDYSLCDDNFYFMKYSKFQQFYKEVCEIDETITSHKWNRYISDIHYLYEGAYYTHESPVYQISRINLIESI